MKVTFILVFCLYMNAIVNAQNKVYIPGGKIVKEDVFFAEVFIEGKKTSKFRIRPKKLDYSGEYVNHMLSGLHWLDGDKILAVEGIDVGHSGTIRSNIIMLNQNGEILKRIVDNEKYQYSGSVFPSPTGEKIMYTTWFRQPPINSSAHNKEELKSILNPKEALKIYNLKTGQEEKSFNSFKKKGMLLFDESPWSPDESKIVYTIQRNSLKDLMDNKLDEADSTIGGSYIFDLNKGEDIDFIPGSYQARWSPNSNVIAYLKSSSIWLYNLDKNQKNIFVLATDVFKVVNFHWTPDGQYFFVQGLENKKYIEKMFDLNGKEIPFKKLNLHTPYFSWK